MTRERV